MSTTGAPRSNLMAALLMAARMLAPVACVALLLLAGALSV